MNHNKQITVCRAHFFIQQNGNDFRRSVDLLRLNSFIMELILRFGPHFYNVLK